MQLKQLCFIVLELVTLNLVLVKGQVCSCFDIVFVLNFATGC